MQWLRERALTLSMMAMFVIFLAGQIGTGFYEYNADRTEHRQVAISVWDYGKTGHVWEAIFENWESEFLQMAVFILVTAKLIQKGSPESRRPGVTEPFDVDPRDFADDPRAPWPVRRGGWVLKLYENSLGLAFILLFLISWIGHALGGTAEANEELLEHGLPPESIMDYIASSKFWFESFQNWQSEFLSIAAMVWLTVYLRQRGSPESKAVHAPHDETGH